VRRLEVGARSARQPSGGRGGGSLLTRAPPRGVASHAIRHRSAPRRRGLSPPSGAAGLAPMSLGASERGARPVRSIGMAATCTSGPLFRVLPPRQAEDPPCARNSPAEAGKWSLVRGRNGDFLPVPARYSPPFARVRLAIYSSAQPGTLSVRRCGIFPPARCILHRSVDASGVSSRLGLARIGLILRALVRRAGAPSDLACLSLTGPGVWTATGRSRA